MITKEKNRTKIICAVVTAISAIVAGGSAFQLYRGTSGNPPAFCNSAIQSMRAARRNGVSTNGSPAFLRSLESPCVQENDSVRNAVRRCLAKSL